MVMPCGPNKHVAELPLRRIKEGPKRAANLPFVKAMECDVGVVVYGEVRSTPAIHQISAIVFI